MIVALWVLREGFTHRAYMWWMVSFGIQFWHFLEHLRLQAQAMEMCGTFLGS